MQVITTIAAVMMFRFLERLIMILENICKKLVEWHVKSARKKLILNMDSNTFDCSIGTRRIRREESTINQSWNAKIDSE
jgi:hypothetical protein